MFSKAVLSNTFYASTKQTIWRFTFPVNLVSIFFTVPFPRPVQVFLRSLSFPSPLSGFCSFSPCSSLHEQQPLSCMYASQASTSSAPFCPPEPLTKDTSSFPQPAHVYPPSRPSSAVRSIPAALEPLSSTHPMGPRGQSSGSVLGVRPRGQTSPLSAPVGSSSPLPASSASSL